MKNTLGYTFPVDFRDVNYIAALYSANAEAVRNHLIGTGLKAGLVLKGKPVVALGLIQYKESDLGAYNEVIVAIPVIPEQEKSGFANWLELYAPLKTRKLGQYIIHIPVDSVQSMEAGRVLWGYPKTVLAINHLFAQNNVDSSIMNEDGNKSIISFNGKLGIGIPIPSMDLMTYSMHHGEMLKTKVDVKANMRWNPFSDIKINVLDEQHPIGRDLIAFEICNQKPLFTISSTRFTAKFNEGQKND
jgi:hypothetical protein